MNKKTELSKSVSLYGTGIYAATLPGLAVAFLGAGAWNAQAEILVNLNATGLPEGPLETWANTGSVEGDFTSAGTVVPTVSIVDGVPSVAFLGNTSGPEGTHYLGPIAPESVVFNGSRTIEAWVHNPTPQEEETIFAWSRRGGPDGTNVSFGHGTHQVWGAVGHWGAPDIGWDGNDKYGEWTYLVYSYDGDTQTTRVYTDGQLSNIEELPAPLNVYDLDDQGEPLPFRVARQSEANGDVSGVGVGQINIAVIRVHDAVLSDGEIADAFNADKALFGKDDADNDGIKDGDEDRYDFLDPNNPDDAALDQDEDGLSNLDEINGGTQPDNPDSDGDGVNDGDEVNGDPATNPLLADTDGDGLSDGQEADAGTNPTLPDSDNDTYPDGQEVAHGSNPTQSSSTPDFTQPLIALDSNDLELGSISSWANSGIWPGPFAASEPNPTVVEINGVKGVQFNGANFMTGPATPGFIAGAAPRTIEAWVYNPAAADEETIFAWGRRGGPEGSNVSFNHGANAAFGAIGHWGAPDIGWNGEISVGEWTYVAYSWDPIDLTTRVYRNGVLAAEEILGAPLNTWAVDSAGNPLPFRLASQNDAGGAPTGGLRGSMTISKIRVHDRVIPESELLSNFETGQNEFGLVDADFDGMPKWYEDQYEFLSDDNENDGSEDFDEDGLTNADEFTEDTDPTNPDVDGDGLLDGEEWDLGTFIKISDSDGDGLLDGVEDNSGSYTSPQKTGTDPLVADSDGDLSADGQEVARGSDPTNGDSVPDMEPTIAMFDLNATGLDAGPLQVWPNTGALGGGFQSGAVPPVVTKVGGVSGVEFNGTDHYYTGPSTPVFVSAENSRTIDAWILNPDSVNEETIASMGRRGGPDGSNFSFNHGTNTAWGAGGIWGAPDIGWGGNVVNGEWTHVAITYDAVNLETAVYSNGELANSELLDAPLFTWVENNEANPKPLAFLVAAQSNADGTVAGGLRGSMTIGRLRVYDKALAPNAIQALYNAEKDAYVAVIVDQDVNISGIAVDGSNLTITWDAVDGASGYIVETSTDLKTWSPAGTVSEAQYTEDISTLADARFYRVRTQ